MLDTLRQYIATRLQHLSVWLQRVCFEKGRKLVRRPWKVSFHKNRKLQSCLAVSLALHLLVIFGITSREGATQFSRLAADHAEVYQTAAAAAHPHPPPTAHAASLSALSILAGRPSRGHAAGSVGVAPVAGADAARIASTM